MELIRSTYQEYVERAEHGFEWVWVAEQLSYSIVGRPEALGEKENKGLLPLPISVSSKKPVAIENPTFAAI